MAEKDKAAFIQEFSESDYNAIEAGWKVSFTPTLVTFLGVVTASHNLYHTTECWELRVLDHLVADLWQK